MYSFLPLISRESNFCCVGSQHYAYVRTTDEHYFISEGIEQEKGTYNNNNNNNYKRHHHRSYLGSGSWP